MPNINKVVFGNQTLIDLSTTTLSETSQLANGITAYDRAGNVITGTASGGGTGTVVIEDTTDSHGGTVRSITAVDISDTTAVAADVAQGKYFYDATGTKTAGTSTGGGGNDFVVSLSKNNQTGYWEPDKTWSEVSAAIADNKTFVFCIAGMTENSELAADGVVYNGHLQYLVYETLQDQSNNYYTDERWYSFDSTGVTEDYAYIYYDTAFGDAQASDILSGKIAFNSSGSVFGSIPTKTSSDLTANNLTVTAPSGYYASDATKTLSDANLIAGNIKKDVSIFGVTGTYEGGGSSGALYKKGTYTPSSTYSSTGNREITTLANIGFTPKKFVFYVTNRSNLSGKSSVILYTMCDIEHMVRFNIRYSNTSGTTALGGGLTGWTMQSNGQLYCDGTAVYYRTSSSYNLISNVEYTWEAFG